MDGRRQLFSGARATGLGTLTSRVLGMARDIATAALLGLSGGGVMDAFAVAFRIPNLFRRLFGECALAASYLPVFTAELEHDRQRAWQLLSATFVLLGAALAGIVLAGELILWALGAWLQPSARGQMVLRLTALLLPYTLLVCLAAQLAASLHALRRFGVAAATPALLNICWLVGAAVAAATTNHQPKQATILAVSILVAGVAQVLAQWIALRNAGYRFQLDFSSTADSLKRVWRGMGPMVVGLAVMQINTLLDSLIAWGLAAPVDGPQQIGWLAHRVAYPMQDGAAAAIWYAERLYQFPIGVLGLAVATAIFPLLSRHAARRDHESLQNDLTLGIRLVLCWGIPASVGLMLLAEPLTRLLLAHGAFSLSDAHRTAQVIACYGVGVWAYCTLPVIVRGFYALSDAQTPVRVGTWTVGLNLSLNLLLVWPLAERGLGLATAIGAATQVVVLTLLFSWRHGPLGWQRLWHTAARSLLASAIMAAVVWLVLEYLPAGPAMSQRSLRVAVPLGAAIVTFLIAARGLGLQEPVQALFQPGHANDRQASGS